MRLQTDGSGPGRKAASENLAEDELSRIEAMQAQLEADYAEAGNGEVSREDLALIIVNAQNLHPRLFPKMAVEAKRVSPR